MEEGETDSHPYHHICGYQVALLRRGAVLRWGDNNHLLVFLAPNIIFIGQMEKDIGRGVS